MKKLLSLVCLTALLLTGCGQAPAAPETTQATPAIQAAEPAETTQVPQATAPALEATVPETAVSGSETAETTEDTVPLSPDAYQVAYSYMITDNFYEYYTFQGLDPEGNLLWTRETSRSQGAQVCPSSPVGTMDGRFYYCDSGSLVALDVITGEILWENPDFDGSIGNINAAMLDPNGFIYLCGYFGPELFIADTDGNTVRRVEDLREDAYWAASVTQEGEDLVIHLEGGSENGTDVRVPMDWLPQAVG